MKSIILIIILTMLKIFMAFILLNICYSNVIPSNNSNDNQPSTSFLSNTSDELYLSIFFMVIICFVCMCLSYYDKDDN